MFTAVLKILTSHRTADIEKSIQGLSEQEVDTLVKYIYRGFAEAKDSSCGPLLAWHEKVQQFLIHYIPFVVLSLFIRRHHKILRIM